MAVILFFAVVIGIPMAIMIYSSRQSKRGCGHGCATCGNREFCHRRYKKK